MNNGQEIIELGIVGIKNMGTYNSETKYEKLNVVTYQGSSYCARKDTVGNLPTDVEYWQLYAQKGDVGATGEQGPKPVKGVDYYTAQDISEIESDLSDTIADEVSSSLGSLTSASPLVASSVADMTDTTRVYVNTTDGHWYWYDGTTWQDGGVYQATEDSTELVDTKTLLKNFIEQNEKEKNYVNDNNLFNSNSKYILENTRITAEGLVSSTSGACVSHPIYVKRGNSYTYKSNYASIGGISVRYCYINEDGTIILKSATLSQDNLTCSFTAEKDGYVLYNLGTGTTYRYISVFSLTSLYSDANNYKNSNDDLYTNLYNTNNELDIAKLSNVESSNNLFNKDSTENIKSKYIASSGIISSNVSYSITHKILLNKNDVVKFYFNLTSYGGSCYVALVDKNNNLIRTINVLNIFNGSYENDIITFKIPITGYYIFNYKPNYEDSLMIVKNIDYPSEYIPYKLVLKEIEFSKLYKKSITLNGDSICAGGSQGYLGGYGKLIANKFNMTYENIAVGGATVTSNTYSENNNPRHWINATITNMNNSYDYAIIEGGVNDSSLNIPLGSISVGYDAQLDVTTFTGAFENMLKQLVTRFAGKKYGYIAVHQMTANYRNINEKSTSYYWRAKECCEKWGVPFLDLNTNVPPFRYFEEGSDQYILRQTYTVNGDGWHPTKDGYEKYYIDKIIAWLENL